MPATRDALGRGSRGSRGVWARRLVVFGTLAVFIAAVYSSIVLGLGRWLGIEGPSTALSVLAMTVVALAFGRVRNRAERWADRLIRGERATPYEVLSGLSELVARSYRHEDVLPRMAALTAAGTGAVRTEIWLRVDGDLILGSRWPASPERVPRLRLPTDGLPAFPEADRSVAVRNGDVLLGAITLTKRPGERLAPDEDRLLEDVASQAGLVLRNVRMTSELTARLDELSTIMNELRASRRRIVETQDHERRRLERDIHDGAQQHLVALAVKLRMARTMAERDPERTRTMIGDLQGLTDVALENLRDLTRGIYPPALAERGVAAALREHVKRSGTDVTVNVKGPRPADPAVEAAVYFTCLEAIQNAAKHAPDSCVRVRIENAASTLSFTVSDDGPGFDPERAARGSGLQNMEDRLAVVGGQLEIRSKPSEGTEIVGRIPLRRMGRES